jgi:hypothetical protein
VILPFSTTLWLKFWRKIQSSWIILQSFPITLVYNETHNKKIPIWLAKHIGLSFKTRQEPDRSIERSNKNAKATTWEQWFASLSPRAGLYADELGRHANG